MYVVNPPALWLEDNARRALGLGTLIGISLDNLRMQFLTLINMGFLTPS
jgi:hypothetical protein